MDSLSPSGQGRAEGTHLAILPYAYRMRNATQIGRFIGVQVLIRELGESGQGWGFPAVTAFWP